MLESISNKAKEVGHNILSDIDRKSHMMAADPRHPPLATDAKTRAMFAGIGALGLPGAIKGIDAALVRMIPGKYKSVASLPLLLGSGLIGGTSGFFTPEMYNMALKVKAGEATPEQYKEFSRSVGKTQLDMHNRFDDVASSYSESMGKEAAFNFGGMAGSVGGAIGNAVKKSLLWTGGKVVAAPGNTAKWFGKNLIARPKAGATFGAKASSMIAKGTALGGTMYGGMKALEYAEAPESKNDYTTMTRNRVLSGDIPVGELNAFERQDISRLGMR